MRKLLLSIISLLVLSGTAYAWPTSYAGTASISDEAYNATTWDGVTDEGASKNAIRDKIETLSGGHNPITLDANANVFLELSTQEVGLDTQTANTIFSGPASGAAAVPTFRALVDNDIPDTVTLTNITQITNKSHTSLTDIGTNTHAQVDTHLGSTANPHSVTKSQVGLGNVENTALSTWSGSTNLITLGIVGTGTWQGSPVADAYVANNITLDNITQITTRPVTSLTGGNWKVFYTNGSGVPTEVALGASGTYFKSNGASSAPTFDTPSGSGDMLKSVYDSNDDGIFADAQVANDITLTNITQVATRAVTSTTGTANRLLWVNGSGSVAEIILGSDGNLLKSNGASSAPSFTDTLTISKILDTVPFADDGDNTKKMQFQASAIGTGITRTVNAVNTDMRIPAAATIKTDGDLADGIVDATSAASVMKTDGACISIGDWSTAIGTGAVWSQAFRVPFKHTLTKVVLTTNQTSGNITIDIWTDAAGATNGLANLTDADSLFDSASEPVISDASADNYVEVPGFDSGEAANAAGDWYVVNVDSAGTLTGVNVCFEFNRAD